MLPCNFCASHPSGSMRSWLILKNLEEDFKTSTAQIAPEATYSNWMTLVSYQDRIGKDLLRRIEEKTNKVKSLRDGVYLGWLRGLSYTERCSAAPQCNCCCDRTIKLPSST